MTSEMVFVSGLLDLTGVHPTKEKKIWQDPWAAIDSVVGDLPHHPYAHLTKDDMKASCQLIQHWRFGNIPLNSKQS